MSGSPSQNRSFPSLRASDKILKAVGALEALATHPEIMAAMGPRHYTAAEKIPEGQALLDAFRQEIGEQDEEIGDRLSATADQNDELREAHALYKPLAETARVVFADDPEVLTALGLRGRFKQSYGARLERMRLFTGEARKKRLMERIAADTEIGPGHLDALDAAVDEAEKRLTDQDTQASLADGASDERGEAEKALSKWMLTMQGHGRVVLRGKPHLLEMLGVPRG
ncbi:MAG TPA: hypothetical protein VGB53_03555 [Rubricoccaceae bacterium]|jgi:hypothetical protein